MFRQFCNFGYIGMGCTNSSLGLWTISIIHPKKPKLQIFLTLKIKLK
jgi:hypothetical protein